MHAAGVQPDSVQSSVSLRSIDEERHQVTRGRQCLAGYFFLRCFKAIRTTNPISAKATGSARWMLIAPTPFWFRLALARRRVRIADSARQKGVNRGFSGPLI